MDAEHNRLSMNDAVSIPLRVGEVGVALIGRSVLRAVDDADAAEPVRRAIHAHDEAWRTVDVSEALGQVDAALQRLGATPPSRPVDAASYLQWSDAVMAQVASATRPDSAEGAMVAVFRSYADTSQALALLAVVAELRAIAPDAARLAAQEGSLFKRAADCARRLANVATLPSVPSVAADMTRRLATTAGLAFRLEDVDGATRAAGLKMILHRLAEEVDGLAAALKTS